MKLYNLVIVIVFLTGDSFCFLVGLTHNSDRNKSLRDTIRGSGKDLQQTLKELRDAKRRMVPADQRTVFTRSERRAAQNNIHNNGLSRVSFKECNLESGRRLDCGHYGINEEQCYKRECCWGETTEEDVPWCYHSKPTIQSACLLDTNERLECGYYGIRKEQCLAMDCCWQPSNGDTPWCFQRLRVPIFEGECGVPAKPPSVMSRIVGGIEATPHSWPWMVSMQVDQDHFCGGSLINNQWIVSAAHCEPAFWWGSDREIVLGMHSQTAGEDTKLRATVGKLFAHENYGRSSGMDNDILLIKLEHPVNFTDAITPVCLPEQDSELNPGKRCYTTGWGHLRSGGHAPDRLQQVMVPIIENSVCNEGGWYSGSIDDTMICAGYEEGGRDSCQGDSGGPLVCFVNGKWTLGGIVSWGEGCAGERKPGVYAKTSKFNEWIEGIINDNLD